MTEPWPAIIPLKEDCPESTPFPVDALGKVLGPLANTISTVQRSPLALCCQSVLSGATLACAGRFDILLDGRVYPNIDFNITVALSGERKDGADSVALRPHREFQDRWRAQYAIDYPEFEKKVAAYEADKKKYAKDEDKTKLNALDAPGLPPQSPTLEVSDPTIEGMYRLFAGGAPVLGLFTTEAGAFLGGWSMQEGQKVRSGASLSKLWDGKLITVPRSSTGNLILAGRRTALHLGMQPDIARGFLGSREFDNQGLHARLLPSWPTSTIGDRPYQSLNPYDDPAYSTYKDAISSLLDTPLPIAPGRPGELDPPTKTLSPSAKALWIRFQDACDRDAKIGGVLYPIQPFACKAAEHAIRLSGILSGINDEDEISSDTMTQGITLTCWFLQTWQYIKKACNSSDNILLGMILLGWLQKKDLRLFQAKGVYQCGPTSLRTQTMAYRAIEELEAANIVREGKFSDDQTGKTFHGFEVREDAW